MSAQVEILVTELDNVLSVPVQAVLAVRRQGPRRRQDADGYERREVALGISNDKLVEVKKGLKTGRRRRAEPGRPDERRREARRCSARRPRTRKRRTGATPPRRPPTALAGKGAVVAKAGPAGKARPTARAKGQGQGQGQGKGGGGFIGKMDPAAKEKFKSASPEEQRKILEDSRRPARADRA